MFSARAKHPDTALAVSRARREGLDILLVTERAPEDLPEALKVGNLSVLTVPPGDTEDGFLATGSVVRMAVVLSRVYGYPVSSPSIEPSVHIQERVIVLHGLEGVAAAVDVETRLHELGLAAVQRTDFRNFAHGRHVGFSRHSEATTILALTGEDSRELCLRTLGRIPGNEGVTLVESAESGLKAAVELLIKVMSVPIPLANAAGIEPSRPEVPYFGRQLYHLPYKRSLPVFSLAPVEQKLRAAGLTAEQRDLHHFFSEGYDAWRKQVCRAEFVGLLLDYDGTCVATRNRWDPPADEIRSSLIGMLRAGVRLAVASGRGDSLFFGLREWIPKDFWPLVDLGLHNGSWQQNLADELMEPRSVESIREAGGVLTRLEHLGVAKVKVGAHQISLSPSTLSQSITELHHLAASLLPASSRGSLSLRTSAHSVDVFPSTAGKVMTLDRVQTRYGRYLSIGDQGGPGGNDFDLLHASVDSITVGQTSADPSRCWPLFGTDVQNEVALGRILGRLRLRAATFRFSPPTAKAEHGTSTPPSE
ncbi:hypothetical protein [Microbacterium sp. B19]|uniref:hypothetical protein n=1 Tax=Microbacterium sp. B19 TaxID=96765 RepID=UPI0011D1F8C4|nr:hypothetical protein [Microbacterium sp. B19]